MTVYADHIFYTSEYLSGKAEAVTAAEFPYYARQASAVIDMYTHGNIDKTDIPDEVRFCCCELAEQISRLITQRLTRRTALQARACRVGRSPMRAPRAAERLAGTLNGNASTNGWGAWGCCIRGWSDADQRRLHASSRRTPIQHTNSKMYTGTTAAAAR